MTDDVKTETKSTLDLIKAAPVMPDRTGWARRGSPEYGGMRLLAVETGLGDLEVVLANAAHKLDAFALAAGLSVTAVQHVLRRNKRAIYAKLGDDA